MSLLQYRYLEHLRVRVSSLEAQLQASKTPRVDASSPGQDDQNRQNLSPALSGTPRGTSEEQGLVWKVHIFHCTMAKLIASVPLLQA